MNYEIKQQVQRGVHVLYDRLFFFLESWGQQSMIMALQFAELSYSKLDSDRSLYLTLILFDLYLVGTKPNEWYSQLHFSN